MSLDCITPAAFKTKLRVSLPPWRWADRFEDGEESLPSLMAASAPPRLVSSSRVDAGKGMFVQSGFKTAEPKSCFEGLASKITLTPAVVSSWVALVESSSPQRGDRMLRCVSHAGSLTSRQEDLGVSEFVSPRDGVSPSRVVEMHVLRVLLGGPPR